MRALVRGAHGAALADLPVPSPAADEVLVRIAYAGVCRTDLAVAAGRLPSAPGTVLGHEASGWMEAEKQAGARVAIDPFFRCGGCAACRRGARCDRLLQLGWHRNGTFAEYVSLPVSAVIEVPGHLPLDLAAYAEPVAAALAVLHSGIRPDQRGVIVGDNRFALLIEAVLHTHGFAHAVARVPAALDDGDAYDFAIEADPTPTAVAAALHALRRDGLLVWRSRRPEPVSLPFDTVVYKAIRIHGVFSAPIADALVWLAAHGDRVRPWLADPAPIEHFDRIFATETRSEAKKQRFVFCAEA